MIKTFVLAFIVYALPMIALIAIVGVTAGGVSHG